MQIGFILRVKVCAIFARPLKPSFPHGGRSTAVQILKGAVKQFLVVKSVLFGQGMDGFMILNTDIYDEICIVTDEEAIRVSQELASKEGILCGISSGTNVAAALKLAKKLGEGRTVVTVLPDTAERYFSTPLFEE